MPLATLREPNLWRKQWSILLRWYVVLAGTWSIKPALLQFMRFSIIFVRCGLKFPTHFLEGSTWSVRSILTKLLIDFSFLVNFLPVIYSDSFKISSFKLIVFLWRWNNQFCFCVEAIVSLYCVVVIWKYIFTNCTWFSC